MIITIRSQVSHDERLQLTNLLERVTDSQRPAISTILDEREVIVLDEAHLDANACYAIRQQYAVERVVQVHTPYQLASTAFKTERSGIRSFDTKTRNLLDLACVPLLRELTHLPVIVDPSHGTGRSELVPIMSRAGIAAGADGLILEVHPDPDSALCDGRQSITPEQLQSVIAETRLMKHLLSSGTRHELPAWVA